MRAVSNRDKDAPHPLPEGAIRCGILPGVEDKLKQRLTGAAILIAIAVLVVPELFRGQSTGETAKPPAQAPTSLPQRSVTIQLQQSGASRTQDEAQAPANVVVAAERHPDPQDVAAEQQDGATSVVATEEKKASQPAPSASPAAPTVETPPVSPALTLAPTPAPVAGRSGWSVQLGVFSQRANAERLTRQAQAKSLGVEISGPDRRGLWRVRSGLQDNRDAAQRWLQRAQAAGFTGALTQAP